LSILSIEDTSLYPVPSLSILSDMNTHLPTTGVTPAQVFSSSILVRTLILTTVPFLFTAPTEAIIAGGGASAAGGSGSGSSSDRS